jgi:hypothetical protein
MMFKRVLVVLSMLLSSCAIAAGSGEEMEFIYANPAAPTLGLVISPDGKEYTAGDRGSSVEKCNIGDPKVCIKLADWIFTLPKGEDPLDDSYNDIHVKLISREWVWIRGCRQLVSVVLSSTDEIKVYFYYTPTLGVFNIMLHSNAANNLLLLASEKGYGYAEQLGNACIGD